MERGIVLNLFEVHLPDEALNLMSRSWDDPKISLNHLRQNLLPSFLYASHEAQKLYSYGVTIERTKEFGFVDDSFDFGNDPRFTGRLIVDAIADHLISLGFELQMRHHFAKVYELTDISHPLRRIDGRLDVFPSYKIQPVFLKIANHLKHFLMINPKVRYRFVHPIAQIHQKVDCTGRYVRIGCPSNCDVYDCPLYPHRGHLAGKITAVTSQSSFQCRFAAIKSSHKQFIQLDDRARFDFPIPIEVCELEASTPNINTIFSARLGLARTSSIISELRVLAGDYLPTTKPSINTEVGRRRWEDVNSFIGRLVNGVSFFEGPLFKVEQEPVRSVEGGYTPEDMFFDDSGVEEILDDETSDDAF